MPAGEESCMMTVLSKLVQSGGENMEKIYLALMGIFVLFALIYGGALAIRKMN